MKCPNCKTELFTIEAIDDCSTCKHNGWYDDKKYHYDDPPEGKFRDQAREEGECAMGSTFDAGCWLIKCANCGETIHMPTYEE